MSVHADPDAGPDTACAGHTGLPAELRTAVLGALDRFAPVLERIQDQQGATSSAADAAGTAGRAASGSPDAGRPCAVCPVCAVIAAWRGERSELAARAVDHAAGLVAVLRAALDEGVGAPADADESAPRGHRSSARSVQHISVHRS